MHDRGSAEGRNADVTASPAKSPGSVPLVFAGWTALGAALAGLALVLRSYSDLYDAGNALIDMPAFPVAAGLVATGLLALLTIPLVLASIRAGLGHDQRLVVLFLGFGLVFRLVFFGSTPVFEDDWYRYLWDGAVTANGYNPYAVSPDEAQGEPFAYSLQPLAHQSGVVIERINHSDLKTIYPPVAQGAFAIAYFLGPWSLDAWRLVCLATEIATLMLLLALLKDARRPVIWAALYWWSPIAVKEIMNAAHMEAITTPFVLAALVLSARQKHLGAVACLGMAAGAKLWPVMLAPLVFRPLLDQPRRLALACALFAGLCAAWAALPLSGGIDETSGFVAYAQFWHTNSAHFGVLESAARAVLGDKLGGNAPGAAIKIVLAGITGLYSIWIARRPIDGALDLATRAGLVTGALFLLSPVQFPWYAIWMLPFLCFRPWAGLLLATALVPIYYASFHFDARNTYEIFRNQVVWLIWLPVWALVAYEALHLRRRDRPVISDGLGGDHA